MTEKAAVATSLADEFSTGKNRYTEGMWLSLNIVPNFSMLKITISLEVINPFLKLHILSNRKQLHKSIFHFLDSNDPLFPSHFIS